MASDPNNPCVFCHTATDEIVAENAEAIARMDANPVTPLHMLFIPRRHAPTYMDLTREEVLAINDLLQAAKKDLQKKDPTITGFNIGMNVGEDAGQTVFHCHVHLIPRRKGDHPSPRGGIRHLMPGKGHY